VKQKGDHVNLPCQARCLALGAIQASAEW
jgi:hypothetical protein